MCQYSLTLQAISNIRQYSLILPKHFACSSFEITLSKTDTYWTTIDNIHYNIESNIDSDKYNNTDNNTKQFDSIF